MVVVGAMVEFAGLGRDRSLSVAVACLDIHHGTKAGHSTWKCGLPAEFIDAEQISAQELMVLKRMPHSTLDSDHHNC
jgi:hypothetical protein